MIDIIYQLNEVNELLTEAYKESKSYYSVVPKFQNAVTKRWIEEFDFIYNKSGFIPHTGFLNYDFRKKEMAYWLDYSVKGNRIYVSTFSPVDQYTGHGGDASLTLIKEQGLWKVDTFKANRNYGKQGKGLTVEELTYYLKNIAVGYDDVTFIKRSTENVALSPYESRKELLYQYHFKSSWSNGYNYIWISSYDGRIILR